DWSLRYVNLGVPINSDSMDELATRNCVLVADDVHLLEDSQIKHLASLVRHRQHPTKLILVSRPHALLHIRSLLNLINFQPDEITTLDEVRELNREEIKELARQALGEEN